ncbi:MAG: rhomboid family intramembrane serine protease [Armatimonadetes bacterium]|nr:rhomboid family intramembrane serine protease [Armatimonadota bacterium]
MVTRDPNDFRNFKLRNGAPATTVIVSAVLIGFLLCWFDRSFRTFEAFRFQTNLFGSRPWTALTYAYCDSGVVSVLFAGYWLWTMGGALERDIGTKALASFWLVESLLCPITFWVGSKVLGADGLLIGPWVPLAGLTMVWGLRNASARMLLFFVVPVSGRAIAWLAALLVLFGAYSVQMRYAPGLAVFAALPLVFAWSLGTRRMKLPGIPERGAKGNDFVRGAGFYSKEYFDDVKRRERDRAEKERLKRLLEGPSGDEK